AFKSSYPSPHSSNLPGRRFSIMTSVSLKISLIIAFPSSAFRLSVIDFLFRACTYHQRNVLSFSTRHLLIWLPDFVVYTLITSDQNYAKILPAKGPAINVTNSNTRNPFNNFFDC